MSVRTAVSYQPGEYIPPKLLSLCVFISEHINLNSQTSYQKNRTVVPLVTRKNITVYTCFSLLYMSVSFILVRTCCLCLSKHVDRTVQDNLYLSMLLHQLRDTCVTVRPYPFIAVLSECIVPAQKRQNIVLYLDIDMSTQVCHDS
jgi:hypothetical protein